MFIEREDPLNNLPRTTYLLKLDFYGSSIYLMLAIKGNLYSEDPLNNLPPTIYLLKLDFYGSSIYLMLAIKGNLYSVLGNTFACIASKALHHAPHDV